MRAYGRLNARQLDALGEAVKGRVVHDLGSGHLYLAHEVMRLGACQVHAVDKAYRDGAPTWGRREVILHPEYFTEYAEHVADIDVALLSWPPNWPTPGLGWLLSLAKTIVYLGSNFNASSCGTRDLFRRFRSRDVLVHEPDFYNTLLVYGAVRRTGPRSVVYPEEYAGLTGELLQYDDYEGKHMEVRL